MIEAISSRVESDYLLIVASGKIVSNEEYRSLVKRYCDEILQSGLKKIIIDETNVDYAVSLLLQADIVEFYSSGELPEEFSTWTIATVGREDMTNMGATSLADIVNNLTENNGAQIYSDSFEQARSAGTANINLRGLGVTSTLVLLNGRRQTLTPAVTENGDQFVDLNTLVPLIAVERVEILKDGASALYGSDAVAGVVNFITRSGFTGFEY